MNQFLKDEKSKRTSKIIKNIDLGNIVTISKFMQLSINFVFVTKFAVCYFPFFSTNLLSKKEVLNLLFHSYSIVVGLL